MASFSTSQTLLCYLNKTKNKSEFNTGLSARALVRVLFSKLKQVRPSFKAFGF